MSSDSITAHVTWESPRKGQQKNEGKRKGRCPPEGWLSPEGNDWLLKPSQEQNQTNCSAMITLNPCSARSLPISKPLSGKMYGLMQVRTAEAVVSSAKHLPAKEKMRKWYQKTSQGQNSAAQSNYSGSVKLCSEVTHKCYQQQVTCKENLNHNLQTKASQHLSRCNTTWSLFCKLNFCFFSCLAKSMTRQGTAYMVQ